MTSSKALLSASALAFAAALPAAAETWDMPLAYAGSNFHSVTAAEFGECVTTGTGGEIEIVTHPSGSLFGGGEIKRAIQTGQVPIGERLLSAHANEDAIFGFDSVPFLATSFDQADDLWEAAKPALEETLAEQNLKLLYSVPWPPQGLYTRNAAETPADLEGVKFRAYNAATSRMAELLGMAPVQIEAAEISQAFATGVADSMVSSGATGYDRKVWESLNHFYVVDAWLPRNYIMVNMDAWEGASDMAKNVMMGCASLAEYAGTWRSKEYTQFTLNGLMEGGMSVEPASEALSAALQEVGETMTAEWLEGAGEGGQAIVDSFQSMQ